MSNDTDFLNRSRMAFTQDAPISMATIRTRIGADEMVSPNRRRDLLSALKRLETICGTSLDTIPARPARIREFLAECSATQLHMSEKTLANLRSLVVAALTDYGPASTPLTRRSPPTREWRELLDLIENPNQRWGLFRLAVFCSRMDIAPAQVGPDTLIGLHEALVEEEVVKRPRSIIKNTIANWNRSMRQISRWPPVVLTSPFKIAPLMLCLSAFPQSFQDDVARWEEKMLMPDFMDEDAPVKALRPVTVKHRVLGFRLFASALVESKKLKLAEITGIDVLVSPNNFMAALKVIHERRGKTQSLHNLARSMRLIGQHHCRLASDDLARLEKLCQRLHVGGRGRMTDANRERLAAFDDPEVATRFLALPERERIAELKHANPIRAAKGIERALALALLIHAGLRLQTLRTLKLDYFRWTHCDECHLYIPPEAMKAGRPHELVLSSEAAALLELYQRNYRDRLPGHVPRDGVARR